MQENQALTCHVAELTQTMVEGEEIYLHDVGHEREPAEAALCTQFWLHWRLVLQHHVPLPSSSSCRYVAPPSTIPVNTALAKRVELEWKMGEREREKKLYCKTTNCARAPALVFMGAVHRTKAMQCPLLGITVLVGRGSGSVRAASHDKVEGMWVMMGCRHLRCI